MVTVVEWAAVDAHLTNSSGGPDEFPARLHKECSKSIAHPLQLLFKASLKIGEIPIDLKRAIITLYTRVAAGTFTRTTVLSPLHPI